MATGPVPKLAPAPPWLSRLVSRYDLAPPTPSIAAAAPTRPSARKPITAPRSLRGGKR